MRSLRRSKSCLASGVRIDWFQREPEVCTLEALNRAAMHRLLLLPVHAGLGIRASSYSCGHRLRIGGKAGEEGFRGFMTWRAAPKDTKLVNTRLVDYLLGDW